MSVYVDRMFMAATVMNGGRQVTGRWCHMTADTDEELHEMAIKIGMKRAWYQPPVVFPDNEATRAAGVVGMVRTRGHYDVTEGKRKIALRYGAIDTPNGREPWRADQPGLEKWLDWCETPGAKELCVRVREQTGKHPAKGAV